jgi:hypothetical protein
VNNDFFDFTLDFHRIFFVEAPKSSLGGRRWRIESSNNSHHLKISVLLQYLLMLSLTISKDKRKGVESGPRIL